MGVSVLGLLLAFAVFWLADNAAVPWLLHSDWFIRAYRERNEAAVQAYQDYVTEQGFTVRQVQEDRDGRLAEGIYTVMAGLPLSIEVTDKSVSSSAVWDGDIRYSFVWAETAGTEADIAAASEVAVDMYPIQCADGAVHIFAAPPPCGTRGWAGSRDCCWRCWASVWWWCPTSCGCCGGSGRCPGRRRY